MVGRVYRGNDVRFSNRPVGVKRFQTIHYCSVDVAHGLVLLSSELSEGTPYIAFTYTS